MKFSKTYLLSSLAAFVFGIAPGGDVSAAKLMGVGSCSSSGCHGKSGAHKKTNVMQNEYAIWAKYGQHSRAFEHLTTIQGMTIARNLGIKRPDRDEFCLGCHATLVKDKARQGRLYRIEEGVSCESCHGAAEHYLEAHAMKGASHEENLKRGLVDLMNAKNRAQLCLDCHFGDAKNPVTHELYAAGHPRLSFELDTYAAIQPAHWKVDRDYLRRKGNYSASWFWIVGQRERALRMLEAVMNMNHRKGFMTGPDFAVLNCFGCHHSLKHERWRSHTPLGRLGQPRWNLSSIRILERAVRAWAPSAAEEILAAVQQFQTKSDISSASRIKAQIVAGVGALEKERLTTPTQKAILKELLLYGTESPGMSYEVAEQIAMGTSAIISELRSGEPTKGQNVLSSPQVDKQIGRLYKALDDSSQFDPAIFASAAASVLEAVGMAIHLPK